MHLVLGFILAIIVGWVAVSVVVWLLETAAIIMDPALFNDWKSMNYFPRDRLYYDKRRNCIDVHKVGNLK
jgi:hypothetical protein